MITVLCRRVLRIAIMAALPLALASCIDEDLSRCGVNYRIDYIVRLQTNMHSEIASELTTPEEQAVGQRLEQALGNVFSDVARDMDLSFYTDHELTHYENHVVNSSDASFTIYLNADDYQHLALANESYESTVTVTGRDSDLDMKMSNEVADTVDTHSVGLFTARLPMSIEDRNNVFTVNMYMQNNSAALVINKKGHTPDEIKGYITGLASGFAVNDSIYDYTNQAVTRTLSFTEGDYHCVYGTGFPSQDNLPQGATDGIWQMRVYVKMNGTTTETILSVSDPLKAGNLKIIKGNLNDDGSITVDAPDVGVSVQLDWKPGGNHEVEI